MAVVTMRELLDSGVHFGHQTRRWNPKMKRFIFTERNGIYIIDIQQSLALIDKAYEFVKDTVAKGGNILFVGTKKQAHEPIISQSARVGMPYVTERWLGGMLTNFATVRKSVKKMGQYEKMETDGSEPVGTPPAQFGAHLRTEVETSQIDAVLDGELEVRRGDRVVATRGPGSYIGERRIVFA